jgi:hypothetical protein
LHRFATERCGYRPKQTTVPVVDGEPGVECQVDFGLMGLLLDPETGRRRKVHAFDLHCGGVAASVCVAVVLPELAAVIAGCEAAWVSSAGCSRWWSRTI